MKKTKTKQMQRCNPPRFKTYRRTKGSGNRAIPYFEGFTTAAISWNQSERSLFYGTKNEWSVIATLQKPVAWLRFLFFQFRGRGVCFIAGDVKVRFIRRFHLREGVIQNMADIILLRAKEYEVIKKVKSHSLVECYEIVQDE
ncbi:hypothetical protein D7Y41_19140 [Anaerotruncus sp. 1XD22-93]|nr:hypothetical protein D7Y41_19140 [Anaerotruncus sp. 1XD22-93]